MKELKEIIKHYEENEGRLRSALACIVQVNGSSYRKPGARILLFENGEFTGSISGGCLDGDALKKAQKVIYNGRPQVVRYDTTNENESAIGLGLGCQGIIDVLIQPLDDRQFEIDQLKRIVDTRVPLVMVQAINNKELYHSTLFNESEIANINDNGLMTAVKECFITKKSILANVESEQYSIQYYAPSIQLVICGHQYDSLILSEIAERIGWQTIIYGKLQKIHYKGPITKNCIENTNPLPQPDDYTAYIIMSHDIDTDVRNLNKALRLKAPYIGLLGPVNRRDKIYEALKDIFNIDELLHSIHTPIGLDIGARTPEEIAIAIIAEVNMFFTKTSGQKLTRIKGGL